MDEDGPSGTAAPAERNSEAGRGLVGVERGSGADGRHQRLPEGRSPGLMAEGTVSVGSALERWRGLYLLDRAGGHLKHGDALLTLTHALPTTGDTLLLVVGLQNTRIRDQQHRVRRREVECHGEEHD